jgi:SagB-type dehydrogenase family enzyme
MTRTELALRLMPPARRDAATWELFHENSKAGRYDSYPPPEFVTQRMGRMLQSLAFEQYPAVTLPSSPEPMRMGLAEAIATRESARTLTPARLTLGQLATLLQHAYGFTRDNVGTAFPRPFRAVPSGGALYPLEIYLHTTHVNELEPGLYHYDPTRNELRFLRYGDESRRLSEALVQRNYAVDASVMLLITAVFERSIFKYGDRGYRFALIEAGHVGQNLALTATALGLACLTIGGYSDRQIDDLLGLDGLLHSTVYLAAIGEPGAEAEEIIGEVRH